MKKADSGSQTRPAEVVVAKGSLLLLGSETFERPCRIPPNDIIDGLRLFEMDGVNLGSNSHLNLSPAPHNILDFRAQLNLELARVMHFSRGSLHDCSDATH